jgi:uncharacterized protein (DUF2141 family)
VLWLSLLLAGLAADASPTDLEVRIDDLRNRKGALHLCLTRVPAHFPDCGKDPHAVKRSVTAGAGPIRLRDLRPGSYAVSLFHDENRNGKLDTFVGIPREGFGFSRNPVVRFGPPSFAQVRVELASGLARHTIRMQYLI